MKILFKIRILDEHYMVVYAKDEAEAKRIACKHVCDEISHRFGNDKLISYDPFCNGFVAVPIFEEKDIPEDFWMSVAPWGAHVACSTIIELYDKKEIEKYKMEYDAKRHVLSIREQANRLDRLIKEGKVDPINLDAFIRHGLDEEVVRYWKDNFFKLDDRVTYNNPDSDFVHVNIDLDDRVVWMLIPYNYFDGSKQMMHNNNYFSALTRCGMSLNKSSLISYFKGYFPEKSIIVHEKEILNVDEIRVASIAGFVYKSASIEVIM